MNIIEKILYSMKWTMNPPVIFDWFHFLFIFIMLGLTLYLSIFQRNCKDKTLRIICFVSWIICVLFEIYKQLDYSYTYNVETGTGVWKYRWNFFPFQFCSAPLYILPFVIFLPTGKIRDAFMSYTASFVLFAGISVFAYPSGVFVNRVMINIQTMVHHGLQIVIGVFVLVHEQKKINLKYYLGGFYVFLGMSSIAMLLNLTIPYAIGFDRSFNMFYISPYFRSTLPILHDLQPILPYPIFLLLYLIGFSAAGLVMYLIYMLVKFIMRKVSESRQKKLT